MDKPYLSVIIPAYREAKKIGSSLLIFDSYLSKQDYSYEIIVVNDGSPDNTAQIVRKFGNLVKNLKLIDNSKNHGKGYVVRQGMLSAKGQYRLFTDADNSTPIEHLDKVWPKFKQGYDVVIGSRDPKDAPGAKLGVAQPLFKRMLGNLGNLLTQLLAVRGIWDTQCGFKAMTAEAADDIFSRALIDRWGFDMELLAIAQRLKYKIGIIPVYWIDRPDSRVGIKGYFQAFRELFKIRWNLIMNKYKLKNKRND